VRWRGRADGVTMLLPDVTMVQVPPDFGDWHKLPSCGGSTGLPCRCILVIDDAVQCAPRAGRYYLGLFRPKEPSAEPSV
jgi:hypothetical protein